MTDFSILRVLLPARRLMISSRPDSSDKFNAISPPAHLSRVFCFRCVDPYGAPLQPSLLTLPTFEPSISIQYPLFTVRCGCDSVQCELFLTLVSSLQRTFLSPHTRVCGCIPLLAREPFSPPYNDPFPPCDLPMRT